ncbi:unnamed protein product, partial [Ectocarpus sp. 12 AP-2014]
PAFAFPCRTNRTDEIGKKQKGGGGINSLCKKIVATGCLSEWIAHQTSKKGAGRGRGDIELICKATTAMVTPAPTSPPHEAARYCPANRHHKGGQKKKKKDARGGENLFKWQNNQG